MAKNSTKPPRKYTLGDLYLIALLSEPIKASSSPKTFDTGKIKESEEYLRTIVLSELLAKTSISSSAKTT